MRADKAKVVRLIKTARGQLDGVLRMIEEDQYCMDIANQLMASDAIIKKTLKEVMKGHITGCVLDSFESSDEEAKIEKIDELLNTLERMMK